MSSTRVTQHIKAPRERVYAALIEASAVAKWRFPEGMQIEVHEFEARPGGAIRVSLTYEAPSGAGKTTAHTDTYHGHFLELVPNERVVEVDEFETQDPDLRGKMTITIELSDANDGTDVVGLHEGLPRGVTAADNETGWRMALSKLATLVETG